ncbi:MAG: DMT family transporter [Gemmataceae bacterium]|nr:DMT family transporter [Gemmataceae bacterium]
MNYTWHIVAFLAGGAIAVQAVVNAALRGKMNHPLQAVLASFAIGAVATALMCLIHRTPWPAWDMIRKEPWWIWIGGLLGVIYVGTSMVATPKVGVALMLSLGFAGQMFCSVAIDHYGWFGLDRRPINPGRILGVSLLILGVVALAVCSEPVVAKTPDAAPVLNNATPADPEP